MKKLFTLIGIATILLTACNAPLGHSGNASTDSTIVSITDVISVTDAVSITDIMLTDSITSVTDPIKY